MKIQIKLTNKQKKKSDELCTESNSDIFCRRSLQTKLGVHLNTVKAYLKGVNNLSIVGFAYKEGNDIYYKRYQKGVNKVLIGVNWEELLSHFEGVKGVNFTKDTVLMLKKLEKACKDDDLIVKPSVSEKIDTLELTPLEIEEEKVK